MLTLLILCACQWESVSSYSHSSAACMSWNRKGNFVHNVLLFVWIKTLRFEEVRFPVCFQCIHVSGSTTLCLYLLLYPISSPFILYIHPYRSIYKGISTHSYDCAYALTFKWWSCSHSLHLLTFWLSLTCVTLTVRTSQLKIHSFIPMLQILAVEEVHYGFLHGLISATTDLNQ